VIDLPNVYVGTSGWSLARPIAPGSHPGLSGLERYAEYFNAVEVNSTFYRLPRRTTIERWRCSTPLGFRFAVKLPRSITHEAQLEDVADEVSGFCDLIASFEKKLGPLLVQLPPRLELDAAVASPFFEHLTRVCPARVVLEPRHASWFGGEGDRLLTEHGVARVGADPACCSAAAQPHGSPGYFRWHGSPRKYFSAYSPQTIAGLALKVLAAQRGGGGRTEVYCFLDNTGLGAASVNALSLKAELLSASERGPLNGRGARRTSAARPTHGGEASPMSARRDSLPEQK
jgi:uncharacterized protein YecE (DUF72 family)